MNLRKLAGQTAIYGLSSIIGRVLNYLLTPLYTYSFSAAEYGIVSEFYAYAGFLSILLALGLETGFFRYHSNSQYPTDKVYASALNCLLLTNIAFVAAILYWQHPLAALLHHGQHPEYLVWFALILAFDTLTALPFAKLRANHKALRFAGIKLLEIGVGLALNLYFLLYLPHHPLTWAKAGFTLHYDPALGIGYIFLANLIASSFKLFILLPEYRLLIKGISADILASLLRYSLPMIVIGSAGMVNEMLDRAILKYLLPYDAETNLRQLGIYGACYKLSMLMSLFVQAFRYAGEPFFFAHANRKEAPRIYARIMRYFVIFGMFIYLVVMLYLDLFQYFIGQDFRAGLDIVPILLIANLLLGIYVNLSVWYKLTNKTLLGAGVAVLGAGITVGLNIWWIPVWGYHGSAWATLVCYGIMVLLSWLLGHRHYPVPYPVLGIIMYILAGLGLSALPGLSPPEYPLNGWLAATLLLAVYILFVLGVEAGLHVWNRRRFKVP